MREFNMLKPFVPVLHGSFPWVTGHRVIMAEGVPFQNCQSNGDNPASPKRWLNWEDIIFRQTLCLDSWAHECSHPSCKPSETILAKRAKMPAIESAWDTDLGGNCNLINGLTFKLQLLDSLDPRILHSENNLTCMFRSTKGTFFNTYLTKIT